MKQIRVPEVQVVSVHAKQVYDLATSPGFRERTDRHDELTRAVDSMLSSCEELFGRLQRLSIESAHKGEVLAVEGLDLGGVVGDVRAARTAIDSASRHSRWKYPGYCRSLQQDDPGEFNLVGLHTLKKDFNDFVEQLARSEKIMHDHREILRELAK